MNLFIVEDDNFLRTSLGLAFSRQPDIEVLAVVGPSPSIVQDIQSAKPDVLVLDLRMPERDGLSIARELREKDPDIKIAILSGLLDDQAYAELRDLGVDCIIEKGTPISEMAAILKALFEGGGPGPQRRKPGLGHR